MKPFKEYLLIERMIEKLWNVFKTKIPDVEHFVPNEKTGKIVFDILNKYVFENKLEEIKITVEHFNPNKHRDNEGNYFIGTSCLYFFGDKVKNFHNTKMSDSDFRSIYRNDGIIITYYSKTTFDKFVSIIAHEMIHQLEIVDPNSKYKMYLTAFAHVHGDNFKYDTHGDFFTKQMNRINEKFRLNIEPTEKMTDNEFQEMSNELKTSEETVFEDDSLKEVSEEKRKEMLALAKRMRKHLVNDGTTFVKATKDGVYLYIF